MAKFPGGIFIPAQMCPDQDRDLMDMEPLCEHTMRTMKFMLLQCLSKYVYENIREYRGIPKWQVVARYKRRRTIETYMRFARHIAEECELGDVHDTDD